MSFKRLCAVLLGALVRAQDGHWIFRHFKERMDCTYERSEIHFWDGVANLLFSSNVPAQASERVSALGAVLWDLLVPLGVADPVMALYCPLGTSAALQELAVACIDHAGELCLQRALRLLHLSKLFMLFSFNDYGAWFSQSRWRTDMGRLSREMQELARVARAHHSSAIAPVTEPNFKNPQFHIGLVTYCNYNDSVTDLTSRSRSNKQSYATRHSYELLHFEQPFVANVHPWMNKLIAIQQNLARFQWLFWVDCDLFFMNPDKTVDSLVQTAMLQNPEASLIISEDGMMLNSGAFLIRNSPWGHDFLVKTVDLLAAPMPHSFQHMPWHEQAPLMYLTLIPSVLHDLTGGSFAPTGPMTSGYDPHVVLLAQRTLNSYPSDLTEKTKQAMAHEPYEEGDLVVSFNGCSSVLGGDYCETLQGRFHAMSMAKFALRA